MKLNWHTVDISVPTKDWPREGLVLVVKRLEEPPVLGTAIHSFPGDSGKILRWDILNDCIRASTGDEWAYLENPI
jgi:hypothetical protein